MRLRQAAAIPSITPKTADSTAETPTSAIVGPAASHDLVPDGLVRLVRAAEVELGGLLEVVDELPARSTCRGRTAASARPAATSVRLRPRNRFATGSDCDDPEQEEVEADDEEQGRERPEDLPCDVPARSLPLVGRAPASEQERRRAPTASTADDGDRDDGRRCRRRHRRRWPSPTPASGARRSARCSSRAPGRSRPAAAPSP